MEKLIKVFQDVFNESAARAQAEEKKTSSFGAMAMLKVWDRPKEQDIVLTGTEKRYEPFWHIKATRRALYRKKAKYPIRPVDANTVSINLLGQDFQTQAGHPIEVVGVEHCEAVKHLAEYFDGMRRDGGDLSLAEIVSKFTAETIADSDQPNFVAPELTAASLLQKVRATLMTAIEADEVLDDTLSVESLTLFYRPVFAFEFGWRDKKGAVEIDGLTGKTNRAGSLMGGMVRRLATREALFDIGGEVAGMVVPGGKVAVMMLEKATAPTEK